MGLSIPQANVSKVFEELLDVMSSGMDGVRPEYLMSLDDIGGQQISAALCSRQGQHHWIGRLGWWLLLVNE